jgi:hypothetical protein
MLNIKKIIKMSKSPKYILIFTINSLNSGMSSTHIKDYHDYYS